MADTIQLLPDSIANQIAAGEVIQRPASVVKELTENAIDAGATSIQLVIKDAGKTLIQIVDNGCGMSETDARMAFERHATSKIRRAQDLFAIHTMGFRGEALASIAAIAHIEMRTRKQSEEMGTRILIEGSELKIQEACQAAPGTSISVKNLFFNIPARRKFLKSNTAEMRHIIEEFQRIAIANPDIFFSLHHNNTEIFHLPEANLRQRIIAILGTKSNQKLVPITEDTEEVRISGFTGKPEFSKKKRGDQYFFVNKRYIKSGYLHHAVMSAYDKLLPEGTYPLYVLFIDVDPEDVDINVHPTKQEIKFDDERLIYNFLKVSIRHALGQYRITPSLDFDQDPNFSPGKYNPAAQPKLIQSDFSDTKTTSSSSGEKVGSRERSNLKNWENLYEGLPDLNSPSDKDENQDQQSLTIESEWSDEQALGDTTGSFSKQQKEPYQIHSSYIVSHIKSGFILLDQQAAHERILFEQYMTALEKQASFSQKQLFPQTLTLPARDAETLKGILDDINLLGFDIQDFGDNSFVINGIPAELSGKENETKLIEKLLEQYQLNVELNLNTKENIARSMAQSAATKRGQTLTITEMQELIDRLFACEVPFKNPAGRHCFITYELTDLEKRFTEK